jgi:hypothetical protein
MEVAAGRAWRQHPLARLFVHIHVYVPMPISSHIGAFACPSWRVCSHSGWRSDWRSAQDQLRSAPLASGVRSPIQREVAPWLIVKHSQ